MNTGVKSASADRMMNSSNRVGWVSVSRMSSTMWMSALFLPMPVSGGQSTTRKPARVKYDRNLPDRPGSR